MSSEETDHVLDLVDGCVELSSQAEKKRSLVRGRAIIDRSFESPSRARTSFEIAGKSERAPPAAADD